MQGVKNLTAKRLENICEEAPRTAKLLSENIKDVSRSSFEIFLGSLPPKIGLEDIRQHFSAFGRVLKIRVDSQHLTNISNPLTNAIIECSSEKMMKKILQITHSIKGAGIKVSKSMNSAELAEYVERSKKCRIYIKRLPCKFENDTLKTFCEQYGPVKTAYCVVGTRSVKNFKYGYVFFENPEIVQKLPAEGLIYQGELIK